MHHHDDSVFGKLRFRATTHIKTYRCVFKCLRIRKRFQLSLFPKTKASVLFQNGGRGSQLAPRPPRRIDRAEVLDLGTRLVVNSERGWSNCFIKFYYTIGTQKRAIISIDENKYPA